MTTKLNEDITRSIKEGQSLWKLKEYLPGFIVRFIYKRYRVRSQRKVLRGYLTILPLLEKNIAELKTGLENGEFKKNRFPKFFNNMLFFNISFKDILVTHKQFLMSKDKEELNLLARTLALHLHEFSKDFQELNGKLFRRELETMPYPTDLLKKFDDLKNGYKNIAPSYNTLLANIRHNAIGHKTKDAKILVNTIKDVDKLQIIEIETLAFLLFALYDKFQKDVVLHLSKHHTEIAKMPYLTTANPNSAVHS